jgi:hypothetical protein
VNLRTVDTGAGTSIELRHVPAKPRPESGLESGLLPAPVRPIRGAARGHGSRPKRHGAAPAALAQLRQAAETNGNPATPPKPAAPPFRPIRNRGKVS